MSTERERVAEALEQAAAAPDIATSAGLAEKHERPDSELSICIPREVCLTAATLLREREPGEASEAIGGGQTALRPQDLYPVSTGRVTPEYAELLGVREPPNLTLCLKCLIASVGMKTHAPDCPDRDVADPTPGFCPHYGNGVLQEHSPGCLLRADALAKETLGWLNSYAFPDGQFNGLKKRLRAYVGSVPRGT